MLGNTIQDDVLRLDSSTHGVCEESKQNCSLFEHAKDRLRETQETCWRSLERRRKHAGDHLRDAANMMEIT